MPWLSARIERKLARSRMSGEGSPSRAAITARSAYAFALLLVGGCFFNADYGGGHYTCSDGICPSGLLCDDGVCVSELRKDAAIDTPAVFEDAPPRAAVCSDPQVFPSAGGMTSGTTTGRSNSVSANCAGSNQLGADAVYKIENTAGPVLVTIAGSFAVTAYALAPTSCSPSPATPACVSNMTAVPGNPLSIPAGSYFIVVDSANAAASGTYTLRLEVQ